MTTLLQRKGRIGRRLGFPQRALRGDTRAALARGKLAHLAGAVVRRVARGAQLFELLARVFGTLFGNLLGLLGLGKLSSRCHKCAAHLGEFSTCFRGSGFRSPQGGM